MRSPWGNQTTVFAGLFLLSLIGCSGGASIPAVESVASCSQAEGLPGTYSCSGECVVTESGEKKLTQVGGETDTISLFAGSAGGLFQVDITGSGGFSEVEIGALAGMVLRTATSQVSDDSYPVLEEYVFDVDSACQATGYTKLVRNPTPAEFKACRILCRK